MPYKYEYTSSNHIQALKSEIEAQWLRTPDPLFTCAIGSGHEDKGRVWARGQGEGLMVLGTFPHSIKNS